MNLVPGSARLVALPARALVPVLRIGVPGASLDLAYRIAFLMSLSAAAKLGVAALATQAYVLQTLRYVLLISLAIGWACEIMVGHLVGSRRVPRGPPTGAQGAAQRHARLGRDGAARPRWRTVDHARLHARPCVIQAAQTLLWISFALETGRVGNLVVLGALRSTGDVIFPVSAAHRVR